MDDSAIVPPDVLHRNLRDIAAYNRLLGANALMIRLVRNLIGTRPDAGSPKFGLDVGIGGGDFIRDAISAAPALPLRWIGLDVAPQMLTFARDLSGPPLSRLTCAMGERLPFADQSVAVAVCALTVHHLQPAQVVQLWRECARVAQHGFVAVDFRRSALGLVGAWLLTRLTSTNPLTRNDGVQSIRRAYTVDEARDLLREANVSQAQVRAVDPLRYAVVWRRP